MPMIRYCLTAFCAFLLASLLTGCAAPGGSVAEKRSNMMAMHDKVLADLYRMTPHAKQMVTSARGYGVFSNAQLKLFVAAAGTGNGVVVDNHTSKRTYMKMGEAGVGLGLGLKDFRVVFAFHTEKALTNFVEFGWQVAAEADAAAKAADKGKEISRGITIGDVTIFQMTESGLALQATLKGVKYWKDPELN